MNWCFFQLEVSTHLSMPTSTRYLSGARSGDHVVVRGYEPTDARVISTNTGTVQLNHLLINILNGASD